MYYYTIRTVLCFAFKALFFPGSFRIGGQIPVEEGHTDREGNHPKEQPGECYSEGMDWSLLEDIF